VVATNWLAISRGSYGVAVLVAPDVLGGHMRGELSATTRTVMRILGVRLLFEAGVCGVAPTRCVLALETLVDGIHAVTMAAVALDSRNKRPRRAALLNVASAAAFTMADYAVMKRNRVDAGSPAASQQPLIRARDQLARRICGMLPLPVGIR
jgi:hypothetical protein